MFKYTIEDYLNTKEKFFNTLSLSDNNEEYYLEEESTHQYHDKIFKKILDNKEEFIDFLKNHTDYEEDEGKILNSELVKYNRNFITKSFTAKSSDVIYKIKGKNILILIEHQRAVDFNMPTRIAEYCVELIRDLTNEEKNIKEYPFIIPIVLYTGKQRWNVPKNINELHKSQFGFEPIEYPKYNLIDVNDYTDEELIEENTGISKAMLFEKKETDKEIMETFEKIFIKKLNKREKECLKMILENFTELRKKIGIRRVNELLEKIEEKGEIDMEALERFFIHMFQKEDELIEKEGKLSEKEGKLSKKEGELAKREKDIKRKIQEERKAGIIETAKKMIVKNMKIEDIEEITGLSEKEILEIM